MTLSDKRIGQLVESIGSAPSVLLLGQKYFNCDEEYSDNVRSTVGIKKEGLSLNEIWNLCLESQKIEELQSSIISCAVESNLMPKIRAMLSFKWNAVFTSTVNTMWIQRNVGRDFGLEVKDLNDLERFSGNFYRDYSKKSLKLCAVYGSDALPSSPKELRKLQRNKAVKDSFENVLSSYGVIVIDGVEDDDWFSINVLEDLELNMESVYIFGVSEADFQRKIKCDEEWEDWKEWLDEGRILLDERPFIKVLEEYNLIDDTELDFTVSDNELRISLGDNDYISVPQNDIVKLKNMGITVMEESVLRPLITNRDSICEYFADFLLQRDGKNWCYFDVACGGERTSFHVERKPEQDMEVVISQQVNAKSDERRIVLLTGNSNSGKTTSLSWLAWRLAKKQVKRIKNNKHIVYYISGNPSYHEEKWQEFLVDFIKNKINAKHTFRKERVNCNIIIWDDYNDIDKISNYTEIYRNLSECNCVVVGSVYSFESLLNKTDTKYGLFKTVMLSSELDGYAKMRLRSLLKKIGDFNISDNIANIFEMLMNFARLNYSLEYAGVREQMKARLVNEAEKSENAANKVLIDFCDLLLKKGIGLHEQLQFELAANDQANEDNKLFIGAIKELNCILSVAGQFNNHLELPLSLLVRIILKGEKIVGEYNRLNRVLRRDSMVRYDFNSCTGKSHIAFRTPSEAKTYLSHNFPTDPDDRRRKEVDILIKVIKNCMWDDYDEASAVARLVRAFGSNSYGKVGENFTMRGDYREYKDFWLTIANELKNRNNSTAVLIASHFTRDAIEKDGANFKDEEAIAILKNVYDEMDDFVENARSDSDQSSLYRLRGEMCRNILARIQKTDNEQKKDYYEDLELNFTRAITETKRVRDRIGGKGRQYVVNSNIQLLDMWLNYVQINNDDSLLPRTIGYIDMLLYSSQFEATGEEDYSKLMDGISRVYQRVGESSEKIEQRLRDISLESYVFFASTKILVRVLDEYSEKLDSSISKRIFFLNEYAGMDFSASGDLSKIYTEIKRVLRKASDEIVALFEVSFGNNFEPMSYRCLLRFLRATWMSYTGNFLLEKEQKPALTDNQWFHIYKIAECALAKCGDFDYKNRAVEFIYGVYKWIYANTYDQKTLYRDSYEDPSRIICLCDIPNVPRKFYVSISTSTGYSKDKLTARIDSEELGENYHSLAGRKRIYVPQNINEYSDYKYNGGKTNISKPYELWFNLGGPQIQDYHEDNGKADR